MKKKKLCKHNEIMTKILYNEEMSKILYKGENTIIITHTKKREVMFQLIYSTNKLNKEHKILKSRKTTKRI